MKVGGDASRGRYLGVDMGGSMTRAHLIQEPAAPRAWKAQGGNLSLDPEAALHVLLQLVRDATPRSACIGLAGARTAPAAVAWLIEELRQEVGNLTLMTDAELALTAAFGSDADGIVVCAGTGSVAIVRKAGVSHLLGGHGFLLDDAGGAYDIGRRLVAAALRDRDRGEKELVRQVEKLLGESLDEFVRRVYADPTDRQLLARLAEKVPTMQHDVAGVILTEVAEALVDLANLAQGQFGLLPVRLMGGVFLIPAIAQTLERRCGAQLASTRSEVAAAQLAAEADA